MFLHKGNSRSSRQNRKDLLCNFDLLFFCDGNHRIKKCFEFTRDGAVRTSMSYHFGVRKLKGLGDSVNVLLGVRKVKGLGDAVNILLTKSRKF